MTDTISQVLNQCLREFTSLADSDALVRYEEEVSQRRWLDEIGRLRVWSGNIGAHQVGQSSLDYRLRDASHLKAETIKLLDRMLRVLRELNEVITEENEEELKVELEDDEEIDDIFEVTEVQQLYQNIVAIINSLFQISMAIRRPADIDRLLNMKFKDELYFEPWARQHVSHKYPEAETHLVDRLGNAMARQKAILKYRERHRAKLSKGLFEYIESDSTILSETVATKFNAHNDQLHFLDTNSDTGMSQTSYASSLVATETAASIPDPPKGSKDRNPFECPYCYHVVVIKNKSDWARHVFRDLMPYLCLSSSCQTPSRLYESRHKWFLHMQEAHPEFSFAANDTICPLCSSPIQSPLVFEKHVGRHLEELALFVLPRLEQSEETQPGSTSPPESFVVAVSDRDPIAHDSSSAAEADSRHGSNEGSHILPILTDERPGSTAEALISPRFPELHLNTDVEADDKAHSSDDASYTYTSPLAVFQQDILDRERLLEKHSVKLTRRLSDADIVLQNQQRQSPVDVIEDDQGRLRLGKRPRSPLDPLTVVPKPAKAKEKQETAEGPSLPEGPRSVPESFSTHSNPVQKGKQASSPNVNIEGEIPPGARWTKIDRRLVSPVALEAGEERFEERSEYVIVMRVLTKEEIQEYANMTQRIRDTRDGPGSPASRERNSPNPSLANDQAGEIPGRHTT